ncbi:MAG: hypothetical protein LWY06_12515, partial [Firmicutes bacterium]|nr:hypothetical protein [Bacillota bacterium]
MKILFMFFVVCNSLFGLNENIVRIFRSPSYWKSYDEVYSLVVSEKSSKSPFALVEKNRHNISTGKKENVFTLKFSNNVQAVWDEKARYTGVYDEKTDSFSVYDSKGEKLTAFPIRPLTKKYISYDKFELFEIVYITDKKILFYLRPEKPEIKIPKNMPVLDSCPMPTYVFDIDWRKGKIAKFFDLQKYFYDNSIPHCAGG